jgi:hypothetical protein
MDFGGKTTHISVWVRNAAPILKVEDPVVVRACHGGSVDRPLSERRILVCARIVNGEERLTIPEQGDGDRTHGDRTALAVHQVADPKHGAKPLGILGRR